MSSLSLLEPDNFLRSRPSKLKINNVAMCASVVQRNQTTTSTRFRVGQFHHFSHRLAAVHGGQLKRGSARVRVTQKDGTVLENLRTAP
ncbi:MAG TPA: hypothetical protein VIK56_12535, partial [Rhodoferax sp.]